MLTVAEARDLDRRTAEATVLDGRLLMEVAGAGAAHFAAARCGDLLGEGAVAVVAGQGNNAGDGFVVARYLAVAGCAVRVLGLVPGGRLSTTESRINAALLSDFDVPYRLTPPGDLGSLLGDVRLIVDAVLGTGLRGAPRPPFDHAIKALNASGRPILALDLPSGLDGDTGTPSEPTIRAQWTVTFGPVKQGLLTPAARGLVGELHVVPLPFPPKLRRPGG